MGEIIMIVNNSFNDKIKNNINDNQNNQVRQY